MKIERKQSQKKHVKQLWDYLKCTYMSCTKNELQAWIGPMWGIDVTLIHHGHCHRAWSSKHITIKLCNKLFDCIMLYKQKAYIFL